MSEPGSVLLEPPPPVLAPEKDAPARDSASPFADPNYGREAEQPGYIIRSHPTWKLEETQTLLTGSVSLGVVLLSAVTLALLPRENFSLEFLLSWLSLDALQAAMQMETSELALLLLAKGAYWHRVFLICAAAFSAMAFVELFVCRVYTRHFDFAAPRPVDDAAWRRIFARWFALAGCFALAFIAYGILGEYRFFNFPYPSSWYYAPYRELFIGAAWTVLACAIPYFWMVERYARHNGPHDEFLILANCFRRAVAGLFLQSAREDARSALGNAHLPNVFLGLLVKFFFVPLMFTWTLSGWGEWERMSHTLIDTWGSRAWGSSADVALNFRSVHEALLRFAITAELTTAFIAYMASFRILDTQVTTAEPTFFGWAMALVCYPPFHSVTAIYLTVQAQDVWNADATIAYPVLSIMCSILILALLAIYGWCTFCFGLRFSNLTNRGIIYCGPYKHVRHPAYICKNGAWLLALIPVTIYHPFAGLVYLARQLGTCGIYYLRAITEEHHLMREPHYQEYCKRVPWRFIPGVW